MPVGLSFPLAEQLHPVRGVRIGQRGGQARLQALQRQRLQDHAR